MELKAIRAEDASELGFLTRMDGLGRVVIPKQLRDRMGLTPGCRMLCDGNADQMIIRRWHPYIDPLATAKMLQVQLMDAIGNPDVPADKTQALLKKVEQLQRELEDA